MRRVIAAAWLGGVVSCNPVAVGLGTTGGASVAGTTGSTGVSVDTSGAPPGTSTSTSTGAPTTSTQGLDSSGGVDPGSSSGTTGDGSSGTTGGGSSSGTTGVALDCENPMPSGQSLPVFDCACEPQLTSMGGGMGSQIDFINNTGESRWLYWINFGGNRDLGNQIPDGGIQFWGTYELHPWVVTDDAGECITIYMPQAGSHDVMIP